MNLAEREEWLNKKAWKSVSGEAFGALSEDEKLTRIRHSSAHVLASAVQSIFPDAVFATGPSTGTGYFYDIRTPQPLTSDDFGKIQALMDRMAEQKVRFSYTSLPKSEAREFFAATGQVLKLEILDKIPAEEVTLYRHGSFVDLCAGPHVPHTGWCKVNQVLSLSSVHWHKEEKIPSLTRVAGTAWLKPEELKQYLEFLDEVKSRDHRNLGPQLDLFSFHPWAASAMWHPHGLTLRNQLTTLWRETISRSKYVEILNPLLYRKELFECSGHWAHFQEDMFIFKDSEGEPSFALKPMNCPDTMLFFKSKVRSYRDLPLRVAEGQILHRNETTGALHGIMRARNFVQDDAHIFLTSDQVESEVQALLKMLDDTYAIFGISYTIRLSTRPENFLGTIEIWNQAEESLKQALRAAGRDFVVNPGDGAFYGPKIDIVINDSLGRQWQCATFQLDFQQPERFELTYSAEDGTLKRPIVIHRAIFGSFERFIGILVEHFGGAFPTWLAPVQAAVLPLTDRHHAYAGEVMAGLEAAGIRAVLMDTDRINYRIRQAEVQKIPYILVVGDQEQSTGTVAVRTRQHQQQRVMPRADLVAEMVEKSRGRTLDVVVKDFGALFRARPEVSTENAAY